jgi:hypothetical protein
LSIDYHAIKKAAVEKIQQLVGEEVVMRTCNNRSMTWKVIACHEPPDAIPEKDTLPYGIKNFKLENCKKSEVIAPAFLMLLFENWKEKVVKMNEAVAASKANCKAFSNKEFLVGLGIMVGPTEFAKRGCDLFPVKDLENEDDGKNDVWKSLCILRDLCHLAGGKSFDSFSQIYLQMMIKRILILGTNFHQLLMNLTK